MVLSVEHVFSGIVRVINLSRWRSLLITAVGFAFAFFERSDHKSCIPVRNIKSFNFVFEIEIDLKPFFVFVSPVWIDFNHLECLCSQYTVCSAKKYTQKK